MHLPPCLLKPSSSWQGGLYVALGLLRLRLVSSCFCFVLSLPLFCSSLSCLVFSLPVSYLDSPLSSLLSCLVSALSCALSWHCLCALDSVCVLGCVFVFSGLSLVLPCSLSCPCLCLVLFWSSRGSFGVIFGRLEGRFGHLGAVLGLLGIILAGLGGILGTLQRF